MTTPPPPTTAADPAPPAAGLRRLLTALPPGTIAVGAGLGVLGLASYVHLAVAGHVLDHAAMSSLAVLWAIVFSVGLGVFFPVEQEMTRIIASGRAAGEGAAAVLRRGALLAGAVLGGLLLLIAALHRLIADHLFDGDISMVWALAGGLAALGLAHTTRGVFAGRGRFAVYGTQLGIDGGLRIVFAAALGIAGVESAFWFSFILTAAPVISVLVTLPAVFAEARHEGPIVGWREFSRGLGLLTASSLSAQLLVNVAVINVRLLDPDDVTVAAAMLSAMVLVRIPLFVFASLQASLLPSLSLAVAAGDRAEYQRQLGRALAVVTTLGGLGGLIAVVIGPALSVALFDAPDVLGASDFAWLAVGTLAYLWALVLGQGVLALRLHRDQTLSWVVGVVVLVALTFAPGNVALRVELGYAIGSIVVAVLLALVLWRRIPAHWTGAAPDVLTTSAVADQPVID